MDFSDSIEQACDINMLLDYYLGNPPQHHNHVSDKEAAACWHRLAGAAHDKLGTGWTATDVEKRFSPKRPDAWQYNRYDVEDCEACTGHEVCPYHEGVGDGLGVLRTAVDTLVDYPEQLGAVLEQQEHNQAVSAEHQLNRHVRSIRFVSNEQIEWWAECLVLEVTGSQPDSASFGGDCHGIYVGPDRKLVRPGGRVEAVIGDREVWFRPGYPTGSRN